VQVVKKLLLAMVTVSVLIFALSGCGVFSKPELGTTWNAKGASIVNTAYSPLSVRAYSLDVNLEFGGIWDSNKVKTGTVKFGVASTEERVDVGDPEYTVIDGTYDPSSKLLQLRCEGKGNTSKDSKITLRGTVSDKTTINNGLIYKTSDMDSSIGTFTVNKQ